ncbi:phosphate ABC transporter substrate-binding/OmpA family protein [Oceanobacter sp. 4_MG-2023]|uniref:phosphate ABC transporter substrate-binding/OmpA family protein n=1 Tax=Oceanobacter sp. 4_MG-2023 TaxID=3062623 RepID=UPI0027368F5E|nr:phosphate ABC transporter substrate-binding/OmpA family protein [Oceanobacter sp. 4_MG-2023]MDP2547363.1 phosphate ABC transporter substrate-binding/OmpA family protein [Oceanobacter sp. 4_MG-2023]
MTTIRVCLTLLAILGFSSANAGILSPFTGLPKNGEVRLFGIQGSNTIGDELGPNLAKKYLEEKGATDVQIRNTRFNNEKVVSGFLPDLGTRLTIDIAAHGSGTGFKGIASGSSEIAASSRPIKAKEASLLKHIADMSRPSAEHIIGIDGLAIVVHPSNPVSELSVDEISEIFSGGYTDWSQVGGRPGAIHVYARDENSGTWDSFKSMVLGNTPLIASAKRFESNAVLSDEVSADDNGIGFVGLSSVRAAKLLAVSDGSAKALKPNKLTVATEDYALSRRLFMYTDDVPENPYVVEFMSFVQLNEAQQVVADSGFISQELKEVVPEFYSELPSDFREITNDAKRLTINFRFRAGSASLDNKALKDIERLVNYLQQKGRNDAEVMLIGFGDKKRTEKRSKLLSKLRAMAVRRELVRNGIYPELSVGYGEYLPVASVNRAEGKMKNRRVEVWLRDNT